LDGTTNFLHGIPHFAISIALERDGEMIAGLIYQPISDEMFWAEKGAGAYLNDHRLRVSARRQLGESLIGTGIPFRDHGDHPRYLRTLAALMSATSGVRRMGVASSTSPRRLVLGAFDVTAVGGIDDDARARLDVRRNQDTPAIIELAGL